MGNIFSCLSGGSICDDNVEDEVIDGSGFVTEFSGEYKEDEVIDRSAFVAENHVNNKGEVTDRSASFDDNIADNRENSVIECSEFVFDDNDECKVNETDCAVIIEQDDIIEKIFFIF